MLLSIFRSVEPISGSAIPGRQGYNWKVSIDERVGPMLHLPGRIALGVNVRNLLQLQGSFQRDGILDPAPQIEKVIALVERLSDPAVEFIAGKQFLHMMRNPGELGQELCRFLRRYFAANLRQMKRQEKKHYQLRSEGLGRCHADLRTGSRIQGSVALAGQHRSRLRCRWRGCGRTWSSLPVPPPECRRFLRIDL